MKQKWIIMGVICIIVGLLAMAFVSQAAQGQGAQGSGPCQQIVIACKDAGFVQGGAKEGNGLWKDCVGPIMQGTPQPHDAIRSLPQINSQIVGECKAKHPDFGQLKAHHQKW
jgi:hypothetical protein